MGPLSPALGLQGIFGKGRVQGHHRDHQHQQRHVGQQQAFCSEAHRLLAARNAGQGIGQRPQPTAEAVRHVHPGGDELHRHGVQQRIGVQLQNAQGQEDQGGAPEAGAGGVEYHIHPQGQHQTGVQQAFDRHLRVAVRVRIQTKAGTPDNRNARLERQRTMDFSLGGEHLFGLLSMDWHASYAKASEERPNERYIDFQLKKQKFDIDLSNERQPFASPKDGSTMTLNDEFSLKELTEQQEDIKEQDLKFSANFKLPFKNGNKLKFGAKVVRKTKDKTVDFYEYSPLDEDAFMENSLKNTVDQSNKHFMPNSKYQTGIYASKEYTGALDLNNPALFEKEQVQEELAGNFEARETVSSGYVRFDSKITDRIELMSGLRIENTNLAYTGRTYDADEDITGKTERQRNSYINFLPSLLVKWNVNDDFKVRGSFTQTLSRPKYSALVPSVNIKRSDNEITIGNPELKPTTSYNFDLSADYYFRSIGLVSAGIFYKKIDDFIVDQVSTNYEYQGNVYTRFTQPKNAGNANLLGVELSYQRDFGFIAPALKCIGFYGTYTYTHSRVEDFNFEGRENEEGLSMPGSPAHTANASLYFEKAGLNIRVSYNFASDFIDEMGESTFYDRYYDKVNYMDANASYTFGKKIKTTFYAEANNLLNQPLRYYQGTKDRTMQAEYYGVKVNAGVKINF